MATKIIDGKNACPLIFKDVEIDTDGATISGISVGAGATITQTITLNKDFAMVSEIWVSLASTNGTSTIDKVIRTSKTTWDVYITNSDSVNADTVDLTWGTEGIIVN